jgi:hypothetical protein
VEGRFIQPQFRINKTALCLFSSFGLSAADCVDKVSDGLVLFERMAEFLVRADRVAVLTAVSFNFDIPGGVQIRDNALHRPFGNPDFGGNIFHRHGMVLVQAEKNVGMVRKKGP